MKLKNSLYRIPTKDVTKANPPSDPKPDPKAPTFCEECEAAHVVPVTIGVETHMLCGACARKLHDQLPPSLFDGMGESFVELDNAMESELGARRPVE